MDNKAFYKYVESRGQAGYGAAILVKEQGDSKYQMLIASETAPSVFGTQDSFEFDLINSATKGKIMGKTSLDDKEVEFLLHRDNIHRLEALKNKTLDFLYFTPDFMGWKFTGSIKVRPNDASADVLKGTYTITPMSADESPIMDARGLVIETICITDVVPDSIAVNTTGETVNIVTDIADCMVTAEVKDNDGTSTAYTATVTSQSVLLKAAVGTDGEDYAIAYITVSKVGYASWTTTIALSYKA